MRCTLLAIDTEIEECSSHRNTAEWQSTTGEDYTTAPMAVVLPAQPPYDEEELHTSFEEAMSERIKAMSGRLGRLSSSALSVQSIQRDTDPILHFNIPLEKSENDAEQLPHKSWRRIVIYSSLACMFTLLGFDIMGLLVLHMH